LNDAHPLNDLTERPDVSAAAAYLRAEDEATLTSQIQLSEIPSPSFEEEARGNRMSELLEQAGLTRVRRDGAGNVLAERDGTTQTPALIVSAHLDTVFPVDTDVSVRRDGDLLYGPGISDDARGLASLLAVARALGAGSVRTKRPVLFVATVGEEGAGDLRGVKHLFAPEGMGSEAAGFISLDGAGIDRIVVDGLGSRRYRLTVRGPGGHSWVDWGTPNPIHALTRLGTRFGEIELVHEPRTTLTVSRIGGGKSINAIPQEAWLEIDTRSAANEHLDDLESTLRSHVESADRDHPELEHTLVVIGDRPGGATDRSEPLVEAAVAATRYQRRQPILALSSTDANIPMARGIPAITLGCGGEAGLAHTTDEWYRNVNGPEGITRALHTILLFTGVA
jgi:acetylornithine deacetylase/succinyl-diaminopimelate desuccinylase-like protein